MDIRNILLVLAAPFVLAACAKDPPTPPNNPAPPPAPPDDPPFELSLDGPIGFQMTAGGSTTTWVEGGEFVALFGIDGETGTPSTRLYVAGLEADDGRSATFRIGTLTYDGPVVTPEEFHGFLSPGARPLAPLMPLPGGVVIDYRDASGVLWSTVCGSAAQGGGYFAITNMATGSDDLGMWVRVVAVFQGTLYNCATGASMQMTDGGAVLEFWEF